MESIAQGRGMGASSTRRCCQIEHVVTSMPVTLFWPVGEASATGLQPFAYGTFVRFTVQSGVTNLNSPLSEENAAGPSAAPWSFHMNQAVG